jgi:hypothetical protein
MRANPELERAIEVMRRRDASAGSLPIVIRALPPLIESHERSKSSVSPPANGSSGVLGDAATVHRERMRTAASRFT